jgi:hypothetical protein
MSAPVGSGTRSPTFKRVEDRFLPVAPWIGCPSGVQDKIVGVDSHSEFREDFDRITAEILLVNVDIALTLATAVDRFDTNAKEQTLRNARRAYDEVLRRRLTVQMESSETTKLEDRLISLKNRLLALGENFD